MYMSIIVNDDKNKPVAMFRNLNHALDFIKQHPTYHIYDAYKTTYNNTIKIIADNSVLYNELRECIKYYNNSCFEFDNFESAVHPIRNRVQSLVEEFAESIDSKVDILENKGGVITALTVDDFEIEQFE